MRPRWSTVLLSAALALVAPGLAPYAAAVDIITARPGAPLGEAGAAGAVRGTSQAPALQLPLSSPGLLTSPTLSVSPSVNLSPEAVMTEAVVAPEAVQAVEAVQAESAIEALQAGELQVQQVLEAGAKASGETVSRVSAIPFERSSAKSGDDAETVSVPTTSEPSGVAKIKAFLVKKLAGKAAKTERTGASRVDHDHDHDHGHDHGLAQEGATPKERMSALRRVLAVGSLFVGIELAGSMLTGSVALKADAMHLASDLSIAAAALFSVWMAQRPASVARPFGFGKLEALTGLLSAMAIAGMGVELLVEAVPRLWSPAEIPGLSTIYWAFAGLASNTISAIMLFRHRGSLSLKGAFLHAAVDAVGSVGVITAGLLVILKGWTLADPLISFGIVGLILHTAWGLAKRSFHVLMDGAPQGVSVERITADLAALEDVVGVSDLRAWSQTSTDSMATVRILVKPGADSQKALKAAQAVLLEKHKLTRASVQIETAP